MDALINTDERIDDLQYKDLKIIQNKKDFCFGIDSVLLADFADIKKGDSVLDIGTGNGIIPILLCGRSECNKITGIEIQSRAAELAGRNVILNKLENRINILCGDIKNAMDYFKRGDFNVIVTNPPYMNNGGGIINSAESKAIARHEILCTLEDVINSASKLLSESGQFSMIHRPHRLVDILYLLRKYSLEPKYLRFVYPSYKKEANLILVKAYKYGKPELKMMKPLYIYDEKQNYTDEINRIYHREVIIL